MKFVCKTSGPLYHKQSAGHYVECATVTHRTRGVRWNPGLEQFEMRCDDCYQKRGRKTDGGYWPLTHEFWSKYEGLQRCKACILERKAKAEARRRAGCKVNRKLCRHRGHKHGRMNFADDPGSGKEWYRQRTDEAA